jgi:hypothetical protein
MLKSSFNMVHQKGHQTKNKTYFKDLITTLYKFSTKFDNMWGNKRCIFFKQLRKYKKS